MPPAVTDAICCMLRAEADRAQYQQAEADKQRYQAEKEAFEAQRNQQWSGW